MESTFPQGEENVEIVDQRWHEACSQVCELTPVASNLLRACVIHRLKNVILPAARFHQFHGKRKIMRLDDVILAQSGAATKGISMVRREPIKEAERRVSVVTPATASASSQPTISVDDIIRYVIDLRYTAYNPAIHRPPPQKRRILEVLAQVVHDSDSTDAHLHRALTIFTQIFSARPATLAELFNIPIRILVGKGCVSPNIRQRAARILIGYSDFSAQETIAKFMCGILQQVYCLKPNFEFIRGALWGLAYQPRRMTELHNLMIKGMEQCWAQSLSRNDSPGMRDIIDLTYFMLRNEYQASIPIPSLKRPAPIGDNIPSKRCKEVSRAPCFDNVPPDIIKREAPKAPSFDKEDIVDHTFFHEEDVMELPLIHSPTTQSPISLFALQTFAPELLSRSDPLLRLLC